MRNLIRKYPVWTYYIAAVLLGAGTMALRRGNTDFFGPFMKHLHDDHLPGNVVTVLAWAMSHPDFAMSLLFPFAPTLAALLIVWIGWGGTGFRELFSRFRPWREGVHWLAGLSVYVLITVVYLIGCGLIFVIAGHYGRAGSAEWLGATYGTFPVFAALFLAVLPYVDGGGMLEELGWRGYALPRMMEYFSSPLKATVVLGALWALWHLPRDVPYLIAGREIFVKHFGSVPNYLIEEGRFIIGCIALSIIATWAFNRTGGSVLATVLVHGASNTWSVNLLSPTGSGSIPFAGFSLHLTEIVELPIALLIVLWAGAELGRRKVSKHSAASA